jgi:hypothetical protein
MSLDSTANLRVNCNITAGGGITASGNSGSITVLGTNGGAGGQTVTTCLTGGGVTIGQFFSGNGPFIYGTPSLTLQSANGTIGLMRNNLNVDGNITAINTSNTGTLGVAGLTTLSSNLVLPLGTVGLGVVSAQSFTTEPNLVNLINNAPTNGMGQTTGFPGLASWTASNQQPLQISGYNGINFVGGRGNWDAGASHMCVVDGQVGIRTRNPQQTLDVSGNIRASGTLIVTNTFSLGGANLGFSGNNNNNRITVTGAIGDAHLNTGELYAHRYIGNAGNMSFRTGGVYNRGADAASSAYQSVNWIPGTYAGAVVNTYDNTGQAACGILCSGQTSQARIEFFLVDNPVQGNAPARVGFFDTSSFTVNGNVNVGISGTGRDFTIYSSFNSNFGMRMWTDSAGTSHLRYNFGTLYIIDSNGTGLYLAKGSTSWVAYSDERLKENIIPITNALDFCASLRTVKYSHIRENLSTPNKIGFIAQDFVNDYPEVVNIDRDDKFGLAYTEIIPIAVAAIKEQKIIVDSQASTIIGLETLASQSSTISGIQFSTLQGDTSQSSTISGIQFSTLQGDTSQSSTISGIQFSTLQGDTSQSSTISGIQFSTLQGDASQSSTISGIQFSTLQGDTSQSSTISGIHFSTLQQENLDFRSTIAAILEKYTL